jgi:pyrrolidone-carboxylate peptidase
MGDSRKLPAKIIIQVLEPSLDPLPHFAIGLLENGRDILDGLPVDRRQPGVAKIHGLFSGQTLEVVISAKGFVTQGRSVHLQPADNLIYFILGTPEMDYYRQAGTLVPFRREEARHLLLRGKESPPGEAALSPRVETMILREERLEARPLGPSRRERAARGEREEGSWLESEVAAELVVRGETREDKKAAIGALARHLIAHPREGKLVVQVREDEKGLTYFTGEIEVAFAKMPSPAELAAFEARFEVMELRRNGARITFAMHYPDADFPRLLEAIEAEREWVMYAEPRIEAPVKLDTRIVPNDYLFPEQWDFQIIQVPEAWFALNGAGANLQFGNSRLIIAVGDTDGIEMAHPDLGGMVNGLAKTFATYDFTAGMPAITLMGSHGTSCASAATAAADRVAAANPNVREGVAGVAPACRLLGARASLRAEVAEMALWYSGTTTPNPASLVELVDVSSISFSQGAMMIVALEEALQFASDFGRLGRGLPLFFSASNDAGPVSANSVYAISKRALAIAASSLSFDSPATREERAPYSNYGREIAVCAPSSRGPRHDPPNSWRATVATVTGANAAGPADGNLPGAPRLAGAPPAALAQAFNADTAAGAVAIVTNANTAPFLSAAGASAVFIANPGNANAEGLQVTGIVAATNRINVRYLPLVPGGTRTAHAMGTAITGGDADYRHFGGTSYSTPVVAGIAALMLSARPTLSWVEVREILRTTSRKIQVGETDIRGLWTDPARQAPNDWVLNDDRNGLRLRSPSLSTMLAMAVTAPRNAQHQLNHGQSTLRLANAAGFEIGDAIFITDGVHSDYHVIEDKAGNTITIDALRHDFGTSPATTVTAGATRPVRSDFYGHGRVNARLAVRAAIVYRHTDRDLAIRNHLADTGLADVDPAVTPIHSPDIWLRNQDDPLSPAPPYDQAGPYQNPRAANDRFIYARIKNIGDRLANLDAWVHFYVALSDHLAPAIDMRVNPAPGIATPFLFPGDPADTVTPSVPPKSWCDITANDIAIAGAGLGTGNANVYHVRANPTPSADYNILIPAGAIPASDPGNLNSGVTVVRIRWSAAHLPPAFTPHAIYLLAYVSPVDGERRGREAGRHNNMSYREIAFADFGLLEATGPAPLPSSVQVDAFGTPLVTPFQLQVNQAIGFFQTERVQIELSRTSDNGSTERAIYRWDGAAWRLEDQGGAAVGWAHLSPPVDAVTSAPAAGSQRNVNFAGDFACGLQHQKVSFRAVIHSARAGAVRVPIAEESFEVQVIAETPPTPGASALFPEPPRADSFVFTDFASLTAQTAGQSFGPQSSGSFRITSVFRAATAPKAYAVAPGVVMVQPVDAQKVNLVLRPLRQPGLRLDHFLDPANNALVRAQAGAPDFVSRLWPVHIGQNPVGTPFSSVALGFDPANQPAIERIDRFFFAAGSSTQYALAKAGEWLGDFLHSGSNEFGFEILLEEGTAQPTFQNIRQESYSVDVSALPETSDAERFTKRLAREEILNYLDPAAFYAMHFDGLVRRPGGGSFTDQALVSNVVDKFANRRKVYLDIRNENGSSYNFYGNYKGTTPADLARNIRLGTSESALAAATYGSQEWPLHILSPAPLATTALKNPLVLELRVNDNLKPVLYVERGEIVTDTVNQRFVDETGLLPGAASPPFTRPLTFQSPNTGSGTKASIAWLFKLHYGRQIEPATVFPPEVPPTTKTLDNLFGPLDLEPLWSGGQTVRWIAAQDRKFVDGQAQGFGQMMERGVAFEGMAAAGRAIFFAALTDQLRNVIPGFRPLRGITGGTSGEGSFLQSAGRLDQYRLDFGSIADGTVKVTTLRLLPGVFSEPTLSSGVLFLGLTSAELERLKGLFGLNALHPRTVFFDELPGPFPNFRKFSLGVHGLQPDGKSGKLMPAAGQEVFAYTVNGLHFFSAAFSAGEPLPTTYLRDAEESVGQQNLDLPTPADFAIHSASDGTGGTFDVNRDLRELISGGGSFQVSGGGANDGTYKVAGIFYHSAAKITTLTVQNTVPQSSASGSLQILPRKIEDHYLHLDLPLQGGGTSPMIDIVETFRTMVEAVPNDLGARDALRQQIEAQGLRLLARARATVRDNGHAAADDRPLYWARLKMQVILKSHEFLVQHPEDAAILSQLLEARTRGLDPPPSFATAGTRKRVLLIGFDPFALRPGAPNNNSHFSSPSALAALLLHNNPLAVQDMFFQAVILPCRYEDFDRGLVDRLVDGFLHGANQVHLILSLGQDIDLGIHVDRFATRFRSPVLADNLNVTGQPAVHYELDPSQTLQPMAGDPRQSAILPRFLETTLPVAAMVPGSRMAVDPTGTQAAKTVTFDQRFRLAGAAAVQGTENQQSAFAALVPPAGAEVELGSAGDFLPNELFYRIAWRRSQRGTTLKTGHLQLPKLQAAAGTNPALFDRERVRYFLDTVIQVLKDVLTAL